VNNIDSVVIAEKPKIGGFFPKMKENIASLLDISPERINIKATTTEGLGFTGRGEGMSAYTVVSLRER